MNRFTRFLFRHAAFASCRLLAQDAEGCMDHPFNRMPGFYIVRCTNQDFGSHGFITERARNSQ